LSKHQLHRAEVNQFLEELEGLLGEAIEEPDEGDLVGKAKPVMRAPALAELHEIFLGQAGGSLELVAGKHYRCDTANAEARKHGSLAYKITPICLVPYAVANYDRLGQPKFAAQPRQITGKNSRPVVLMRYIAAAMSVKIN
jgi:hypothetical protein